MESSWKAGSDSLLLGPMIGKGKLVGSFGTLDELYSVSVSVSSAACRSDPLTGFPDALKTRTVLRDSSPAKSTFFTDPPAGSDWARCCKRTPGTWGEEWDDLRECLRGLPLERMMGVNSVREV